MIKIDVLTKKWGICIRSDKAFNKKFPDCHAIALLEDRRIFVRKSSVNIETILHELVHAYQYELSFHELQLDDDQVEEWYAELFAKYGETMLKHAKSIVQQFSA